MWWLFILLGFAAGFLLGIVASLFRMHIVGTIHIIKYDDKDPELYLAANQEQISKLLNRDYAVMHVKKRKM